MALLHRRFPPDRVHCSERGRPCYLHLERLGSLCQIATMSYAGDCYDSAVAGSCLATLQAELVHGSSRWGSYPGYVEHDHIRIESTGRPICGMMRLSGSGRKLGPSMQPHSTWRSASYTTWNEWLLEYTFSKRRSSEPVEHIPASLEDLCAVIGESPARATDVLRSFTNAIRRELDDEKATFERYCLKYRRSGFAHYWSAHGEGEPYFFGCLWLTCLVASGYPADGGHFYERLARVLGRQINLSSSELGSLDDVWEDLAEWSRHNRDHYRELRLPARDDYRKIIGRSFYLAFPNQRDRQRMRTLLAKEGLLGSEPPISLVIEVLLRARNDFETEFQHELNAFVHQFMKSGRDPRESPFWRAVRQEVLAPSPGRQVEGEREAQTMLMARFDADELLELYLACTEDYPVPMGFNRKPLDLMAIGFRHRLEPEEPSVGRPSTETLLTGASRRAYQQGVLPLLDVATGEYRLARGEEVTECELALVRDDRIEAFVQKFGGTRRESALNEWEEISHCRMHQLDALPEGLAGVNLLLHTTEPQKPRFVGGLRTSTGAFQRMPGYLPCIHAPGASKVEVRMGDAWVPCLPPTGGQQRQEWLLPEQLDLAVLDELHVAATWSVVIEGNTLQRRGETRVPLEGWSISLADGGLPSGDFWLETVSRRLQSIQGPLDEVSLGITTDDRSRAMDVLFFDASARWLGPGVGEMSLISREGFQWLAIGPKKAPTLVVFVGDATHPVFPDGGTSPEASDRRHWKQAFSRGRPTFVRRGSDYVRLSDSREVQEIYSKYVTAVQAKHVSGERRCEATHLDSTLEEEAPDTAAYPEPSRLVADVLSNLAHHRRSLPLREVHEHLARLTGTDEQHSLRYHLVRAFAEMGAVDLLLRVDGRRTLVVPRRPRLVIYRTGPHFRGVVMGLLPFERAKLLARDAERLHLKSVFRASSNPFQPPVVRLEAFDGSLEPFVALSQSQDFPSPEFLDWPDTSLVPEHFTIRGSLSPPPVPDMYVREATWCWKTGAFLRVPADCGDVSVELRKYSNRAPIYVVLREGEVCGWSSSRAWALLDAAERWGRPPFVLGTNGILYTTENTPMHLPMPLARLCTVVGIGVPGPRVEKPGDHLQVISYQYPFGKRLVPLVVRAIPASWFQRKVD